MRPHRCWDCAGLRLGDPGTDAHVAVVQDVELTVVFVYLDCRCGSGFCCSRLGNCLFQAQGVGCGRR